MHRKSLLFIQKYRHPAHWTLFFTDIILSFMTGFIKIWILAMEKDSDYQTYIRKNSPDSAKIRRGTNARKERFESVQIKNPVCIDEDILKHFQRLASEGQGCERLINQALREWLSFRNVEKPVCAKLSG